MAWTIVGVTVFLLGGAVVAVAYLRRPRVARVGPVQAGPPPRILAQYVLCPAPRVGGMSLRDWLVHSVRRDGVWAEVVAEFYADAASDPEIFGYFAHVNMERLKRHFLATLLILVHSGLTLGVLDAMRDRHAGLGITGPVFDRTIQALTGVLFRKGVPAAAVADLGPAVAELRAVIVEDRPERRDSSHR